jgi:hypothetical protein
MVAPGVDKPVDMQLSEGTCTTAGLIAYLDATNRQLLAGKISVFAARERIRDADKVLERLRKELRERAARS